MPHTESRSQSGKVITKWHLQYPLELLTKTIQILATHPQDARTRLTVAWSEFAQLGGLLLPAECELDRDSIIAEYLQRSGGQSQMRNKTAAGLASRILALQSDLRVLNDEL
jgi:hypothetical protein